MNSALHAAGGAGPAGSAHQASCTHGSAQEVQSAPVRSLPTRAVKIILLPVPGSFPPLPSDVATLNSRTHELTQAAWRMPDQLQC